MRESYFASYLSRITFFIILVLSIPSFLSAGESLSTWGYVHIGNTGADTSNGLYLRNYIANRSDEVQYLHQNPSIYFIDINDSTKAWISDAGNFPTPESMGDADIALIDWENNPGTVGHMGYYAVINDTIWDPAVHTIQQFNDCHLRVIPKPDTVSTVGQIELLWYKAIEDLGIPDTINIIGYNVYRGHNGIDFPLKVNPEIVTDTFFTDTTASIGDSIYYYALKLVYRGSPDTIESQYFSTKSPMIPENADIETFPADKSLKIEKIFPNPFTTSTTISFSLPNPEGRAQSAENIELKIYDLSGRLVKSFSLTTNHSALSTAVFWDGKNRKGKRVSSGVYFVKFKAGSYRNWKKIILFQ